MVRTMGFRFHRRFHYYLRFSSFLFEAEIDPYNFLQETLFCLHIFNLNVLVTVNKKYFQVETKRSESEATKGRTSLIPTLRLKTDSI